MPETIQKREISEELRQAYLDYAMSVIVSRALPDARDGLKPVQRRILYVMHELGLNPGAKFTKAANIVGNALARYHPHGDSATYEALVRMAQDFSLRYPLAWGQGNFGCFTKDTRVRLVDGRNLSFEELIQEQNDGKKHWTFTFNPEVKTVEITEIQKPRLTRKDAKIIEVTLDNGEKIECTPDHLFMLRDGNYRAAQDLKINDSLMPCYTKINNDKADLNLKGYEVVYQPTQRKWDFVHRLADDWNLRQVVYQKNAGRIRHHIDFNKLNNNPDNILRIQWQEHWKLHKEIASGRHKDNPDYVRRIAEGRKKFWADPKNREKASIFLTKLNRNNWKKLSYRLKMSQAVRTAWQNPGYRANITEAARKNLKNLWGNKDFQNTLSRLKSEEMKKRWRDKEYRSYWQKKTKEISLKIWSDPRHREYISKLMKEKTKDLAWRQRRSEISKKLWEDPEYKNKYTPEHFSAMAKKLWSNPSAKKAFSRRLTEQWQDPEFKARVIKTIKTNNKQRLIEQPDLMKILTAKAKISLRENWKNPTYKERVIKSKVLSYVGILSGKHQQVTPEIYEQERTNNGVPKIENTLNYFGSFEEILQESKQRNHKITKIRFLRKKKDTYDLTVEPWHNFSLAAGVFVHNSIDGDPAAAHRYTEAKLAALAEELLADIEKDTVDFNPNYDNTKKEPVVLPAKIPNLLLNGSVGIAVGMATNIPPHNLSELTEAVQVVLDDPSIKTKELLKIVQGPDFPTGGIVFGKKALTDCYTEGRGSVVVRGRVTVEERKRGGEQIVITEIPWQVNKAELVRQIATLSLAKTVPEIKDVRDESNKSGIRVVIELKESDSGRVIERLYRLTDLQKNYHFNLVALENGIQPKLFGLKELLLAWLAHRKQVVYRRTKFDLERTKERIHLLEGFQKALDKIDLVIAIIRKAKDKEEAKVNLRKKLDLSEKQTEAILELPLRSLTSLERLKIKAELEAKGELERQLSAILKDPKKIEAIIKAELIKVKDKFADKRRTDIVADELEDKGEIVEDQEILLFINPKGRVTTFAPSVATDRIIKDKDNFGPIFFTRTTAKLWVVSRGGKIYQVPVSGFHNQSKYLESQLVLEKNDAVLKTFMPQEADTHLLILTKNGFGKKLNLQDVLSQKRTGTQVIRLKQDEIVDVASYKKNNFIALSQNGLALAFRDNLPIQGKAAQGVRLMKLVNDQAFSLCRFENNFVVFAFAAGFWKKISTKELKLQQRGGKGVRVFEVKDKLGPVIFAASILGAENILAVNHKLNKINLSQLPPQRRIHQPQKLSEAINQVIII